MWNPQQSMATILAAAEAGEPLTVTENEIRERLSTLIKETQARRGTMAGNGEYRLLCRALDKIGGRNV